MGDDWSSLEEGKSLLRQDAPATDHSFRKNKQWLGIAIFCLLVLIFGSTGK